jgi:hypothetical protein
VRFALIAIAAAAGFFSWFSWHSNSTALASSGFLGTWCRSGSSLIPQQPITITDSPRLIIKDPKYGDTYARIVSSTLVAERWAQTATLSFNGDKITWPSGETWVRCASASIAEATPKPERLRIQSYIVRNYKSLPIHIYLVGLHNADTGRYYNQCVSFRNVSTKVATSVDLSFVVETYSGTVEADFGVVDRGTFTPPVDIADHCWHGPLWSDRVVRLMAREVITVKRVTFKDETSWEPGMPFRRGYENGGKQLPEPIEEHPESPKPTPGSIP